MKLPSAEAILIPCRFWKCPYFKNDNQSFYIRRWHPTLVLLPDKSHGRRSLVGCSPWVAKSWAWLSDFTFTFHFHALEKAMATHSSALAWRIPGTAEPGGLPSTGLHRVGHNWSDLATYIYLWITCFFFLWTICEHFPFYFLADFWGLFVHEGNLPFDTHSRLYSGGTGSWLLAQALQPRWAGCSWFQCGARTAAASLVESSCRHLGLEVMTHGLSCSTAGGIFPDQGSKSCPLHWQADSWPLDYQGSPRYQFCKCFYFDDVRSLALKKLKKFFWSFRFYVDKFVILFTTSRIFSFWSDC